MVITKEHITQLEKDHFEIQKKFSEFFNEMLGPPKEMPLKSIELQNLEREEFLANLFVYFSQDFREAVELFFSKCEESDLPKMTEIFKKIFTRIIEKNETPIPDEDFIFLDKFILKVFERFEYKEASCMFRLLLQFNPFWSAPWVGWAVSEEKQGRLDVANLVYDIGTEFLPLDEYMILFAVDFYRANHEEKKAIEILKNLKEGLLENNKQNTDSFKNVEKLLNEFSIF